MTLATYATQSDVEFVLGQYGLRVRGDDNDDGGIETGYVADGLEVSAAAINVALLARYAVSVVSASTWVKWVNAYLAAEVFCRRRGNGAPASLKETCDEYRLTLTAIKAGQEHLMGDTGPAAPKHDNAPAMSNHAVDRRYHRAKVRTVRDTSAGDPPQGSTKRNDVPDYLEYFP